MTSSSEHAGGCEREHFLNVSYMHCRSLSIFFFIFEVYLWFPLKSFSLFYFRRFQNIEKVTHCLGQRESSKIICFCFVWCLTFMWAGSYKRNFYLLHCITIHCSLRLKKEIKGNSSEPIKHVGSGDKKPFFSIHYNKLLYRKYDTFSTSLILFLCFYDFILDWL